MSKPTFKITRSIRSQQVLNTFMERVLKNLSSTVGFDCLVVQTKTPLLIHPEKLSNSFLQFFKMLLHFGVEIVFPRMWWGIARDAFQLVQEDKFCRIRKMMSSKSDPASQINHIRWFFRNEGCTEETVLSFAMRYFFHRKLNLWYNHFLIQHKYGNYNEGEFSNNAWKQLIMCRVK